MTTKTPTADDLAHAKFARHPDGRIAARLDDDKFPWITATDCYGDTEMADAGWLPVRECPDPEQHDDESRPLTPDAITDEMVERFRAAWADRVWDGEAPHENFVRPVLAATLTEPSKRPDGAEDIEALIREAEKVGQGADDEALANYLAARLNVSPKENR